MLLRTRFYLPPLRENLVVRDRLHQRLQQCCGGSMILISAPAGYGKTTLVSQWLHQYPQQFAWLGIGPEHDVSEVFWQYLIQALQRIQPGLGCEDQDMGFERWLVRLLNDLDVLSERNRSDSPVTLVLDDFHFVRDSHLLGMFNRFLDHLPPAIRLVVTSRDLPDLKLARRRASGQLVQLEAEDLRFDEAESVTFFHDTMSLFEQIRILKSLGQRAEGWIAGMQLMALSLRSRGSAPESLLNEERLDRHVSDYLLEEVFQNQSEENQHFLMVSALAPRFCAALCNHVDARKDSQQIMMSLETGDLFLTALDNHRGWYRYHDLFRQFLLNMAASQLQDKHEFYCLSALDWLQANGHFSDAMELCLQQSMWSQALQLLDSDWLELEVVSLEQRRHWLARIPVAHRRGWNEQVPVPEHLDAEIEEDQVEPLTRREQAVLELIAKGLSNREIAEALFISQNTLKVHIRNLYGKMGVQNRAQALVKIRT